MLSYSTTTRTLSGTVKSLSGGKAIKIEPRSADVLAEQYKDDPAGLERAVAKLQLAVYILLQGGGLARFASCQPAEFYIDQRCSVSNKRAIYNAVAVLCLYADAAGYDLHGFNRDGSKKSLVGPSIPMAGWILSG